MRKSVNLGRGRRLALLALVGGTFFLASAAAEAQAPTPPDQLPTPRDAAGHPSLVGIWNAPAPGAAAGTILNIECNSGTGREKCKESDSIDFVSRDGTFRGFEEDGRIARGDALNRPVYKPEYWDTIQENDIWSNWRDPANYCIPYGLPRMGPPTQIVKLEGQPIIEILYSITFHPFNSYRFVPTDGRPHNAAQAALESYMGDAAGHWEGDTLVIETVGFTDNFWFNANGWIHGFKMKLTEKLTRKGNTLRWDATVEDPDYFQEPWVLPPRTVYLNTDPDAFLSEALPCDSRIKEPWGTEDRPTGSPVH